MVISTNQNPTIYRNLYENTGPGHIGGCFRINDPGTGELLQKGVSGIREAGRLVMGKGRDRGQAGQGRGWHGQG